jgi:hypothetical protein
VMDLRNKLYNDENRQALESICKWWLEFTRNLIVVGLTQYLAHKSGSVFIYIFSWITRIAFGGYYVVSLLYHANEMIEVLGRRHSSLVVVIIQRFLDLAVDQLATAQAH